MLESLLFNCVYEAFEENTFERAESVERFVRDKLYEFRIYRGNPSIPPEKVHLLAVLPNDIASLLNLEQPNLKNFSVLKLIKLNRIKSALPNETTSSNLIP